MLIQFASPQRCASELSSGALLYVSKKMKAFNVKIVLEFEDNCKSMHSKTIKGKDFRMHSKTSKGKDFLHRMEQCKNVL